MKIKDIKKDGYNLHLVKNNKFKTSLVKIVFWKEIKENELTKRCILMDNLLYSSKKYPTEKEIFQKKQDLYGIGISSNAYRRGSYMFLEVNLSVINEKYTEKGLISKSLDFLFELLQNPNVENDKFNEMTFEIIKEKYKLYLKSLKENPNYCSLAEYKKLLGEKIYTYQINGNLKDLETITPENLYTFYKSFFKTNNIDVVVVSNMSDNYMENLISDKIKLYGANEPVKKMTLSYIKPFSETKKKTHFSQSVLMMGGSTSRLTKYEKNYVLLAYNILLGNSPNSKLFKNVREKHSYAYSILSKTNKFDGTFIIQAGIRKANYNKVKEEIEKEMLSMKKGNFTKKEVKNAQEVLLTTLNEVTDYQPSIADYAFTQAYFDNDTYEETKEKIKNIEKEEIIRLANKLKIDTILLNEESRG